MAECSSANKIYYADTYTYLVINFLEENVFRQQLKIECSCSCQDMQEQWRICGEGTQRGSEYSCSKASFFLEIIHVEDFPSPSPLSVNGITKQHYDCAKT